MSTARAGHTATLISGCNCPADGKVLIAGGATPSAPLSRARNCSIQRPENSRRPVREATRAHHSATLIESGPLSGNVLIAGGTSDEGGGDVATAELYDPTTGQFTSTGTDEHAARKSQRDFSFAERCLRCSRRQRAGRGRRRRERAAATPRKFSTRRRRRFHRSAR